MLPRLAMSRPHTMLQPVKVSARQYCSYLMEWVQQQLDDEAVFPSAIGDSYPLHRSDHPQHGACPNPHFTRHQESRFPGIFKSACATFSSASFGTLFASTLQPNNFFFSLPFTPFFFPLHSVYGHIYHRHRPALFPSPPFDLYTAFFPFCGHLFSVLSFHDALSRSHLDAVVALEIEPHLNTCFRHFM